MNRIKLADRSLPTYSRAEEWFNAISHMAGGAFGIAALVLCLVKSALLRSAFGVVSSVVYGLSLILLYACSSVYHALRPPMAKKVMQVLDHCAIYFLIAGTYTPILLCGVRGRYPVTAWVLFSAVWGLCFLATTLTAIDLKKYKVFSMICYIGMGWAVLFAMDEVVATVASAGLWWLVAGGVAYTVGAVLFGIGARLRWFHSVFHLFVLLGSVCHFITIFGYVL